MEGVTVDMNLTGESSGIYIRRLEFSDAQDLLALRVQNRDFVKPWEPILPDQHFTLQGQQEVISKLNVGWNERTTYGFGIFLSSGDELIGRVTLSNVVYGAFESCTIGYFMDEQQGGRGYMTAAVQQAAEFAFAEAGLHRIQAAVIPRNQKSVRVVEKAGFRYEGLAKYYLRINGTWEDHNIYSLTREYWKH